MDSEWGRTWLEGKRLGDAVPQTPWDLSLIGLLPQGEQAGRAWRPTRPLDDHSRLCCHAQWYLAEGAEELCHGLSQGFKKRQLPRSILFDNGSAMMALIGAYLA